jgi:hypothetical protein
MSITTYTIQNSYDLIDLMRTRTAMYLGEYKISAMWSFLEGYNMAIRLNNVAQTPEYPPFWYFHEWAKEKYKWGESTAGWKNIILQENGGDEEKALTVFFEMMTDFQTLMPLSIEKVSLSAENMRFHHSSECATRYGDGSPVHKMATDVFLVEFSHNFGFAYFVINENKMQGTEWTTRFKTRKAAKAHIATIFGVVEMWTALKGDLKAALTAIL